MRSALLSCFAVLALSAAVLADDHSVIFDEDVDFSTFKTFMVSETTLKFRQQSLDSPVLKKTLGEVIRTGLTGKGLKETLDRPDIVVECRVTGADFDMRQFGQLVQMGDGRGRGGRREPTQHQPDFTEATLVIDVKRPAGDLLFRGVYHDTERDASKLADRLPKDAATLLSKYPGKRMQP